MSFVSFGAPADWQAAFPGKTYPEQRAYYEAQGWLKPPGVTEIHHFEHVHIGMAFPYAEEWVEPNGAQTVDVAYTFHNVSNYTIQKVTSQFVDGQNSGGGFVATAAQVAELQAAMNASAGTTVKAYQTYTMKAIGVNCRKTFKLTMTTLRANAAALVDEWFPALHITTYVDYASNTKTCISPELNVDQARGRDWIKGGAHGDGYIYSTNFAPPASAVDDDVPEPWDLMLGSSAGDGFLYVDPDFHAHPDNLGIWSQDLGFRDVGSFPVQIPTDTFPPGWHRLVYVLGRADHASVVVVPFKVAGTPTTCPTCGGSGVIYV